MAESLHTQVVAGLKTSLAGIVANGGVSYHYTPAAVASVLWWDEEEQFDETLGGPIYLIRPGEERVLEADPQVTKFLAEIFILLAQPFTTPDTAHEPAAIPRAVVQDRMIRDVLRKLLADPQLVSVGGAVENVIADELVVDRDRWVEGWAVAELRTVVQYRSTGLAL